MEIKGVVLIHPIRSYIMKLVARFNFIYWITIIGIWLFCFLGLYRSGIIPFFFEDCSYQETGWLGVLYHLILSLLISSPSIPAAAFVFSRISKNYMLNVFNKAFPVNKMRERKIALKTIRNEFRESPFSKIMKDVLQPPTLKTTEKEMAADRLNRLAARYSKIESFITIPAILISMVIGVGCFYLYVEVIFPGFLGSIQTIYFCLFTLFCFFLTFAVPVVLGAKVITPYLDRYAIRSFNQAFPVQNGEKRQKAVDILNDKNDKYSFAEAILNAHSETYSQYFNRVEKIRRKVRLMLSDEKPSAGATWPPEYQTGFSLIVEMLIFFVCTWIPMGLSFIFIVEFFTPRFGRGIGLLIAFFLIFTIFLPIGFYLKKALPKALRPLSRNYVINIFDNKFPPEKKDERKMAIDVITNEFSKKNDFAKKILESLKSSL